MDRRKEDAAQRPTTQAVAHRWRFWENARGDKVIANDIDRLPAEDALSIHAQMIIVRQDGLKAARHLVEDIYEVEAHGIDHSYRLLFTSEGKKARILLAVVLIEKKTQKTPNLTIALAKQRRDDLAQPRSDVRLSTLPVMPDKLRTDSSGEIASSRELNGRDAARHNLPYRK